MNLVLKNEYWMEFIKNNATQNAELKTQDETVLIEYSSPNTNKPIHLGHLRNNVLGYALAGILKQMDTMW